MALYVIFPNQLYTNPRIPANHTPVLIEEPAFFFDPVDRPFHTHKLKIAFMRATMQQYYNTVLGKKGLYIEYKDASRFCTSKKNHALQVTMLHPHDEVVLRKYTSSFPKLVVLEDPYHFLLSDQELATIKNDHPKRPPHLATLYNIVKQKYKILVDQPSTDAQNRLPIPRNDNDQRPKTSRTRPVFNHNSMPLVKGACSYAEKHFPNHPGSTELLQHLPLTHTQAKMYLKAFVRNRLENYGPYQDAIDACDTIVYHSHISYLINCGLLRPLQVLRAIMRHAKTVPINSLEGFIRQLLGWREYMHYIYVGHYADLKAVFEDDMNPTLPQSWYTGSTGIVPLDHEIKKVHGEAWAHHIVRLMVFLNLAKLSDFPPAAIYRWFMEMVSLDAYEWVMYSNIAAMGMYDDRFMSKPYLSTSNYILKMSNYEKDPMWTKQWDAMFYNYLVKHTKSLTGKSAIYLRNLAYYDKQTPHRKRELLSGTKGIRAKN